ncbi:neuroguidin-A-like [Liolophura sinensis]|uniref:neuroguidin-A-like n=1 Tax=Liolophura sinensis TaxID=3198878 RepID=UPI003158DC8C
MTSTMEKEVSTSIKLFNQITDVSLSVTQHVQNLIQKVKNGDISTSKGISLLEGKYQMLLSYLTNLSLLMLRKSSGESIQDDPVIMRLVEIRTVLEKIRPIDQKLKYQIDKLLKMVSTGAAGTADPLRFRPNPGNLISKLDEADSASDSDEEAETRSRRKSDPLKLYVPPKLAAVHYDGEETQTEREQRLLERAKRKALSSSMIQDLRQEYSEGPQEIRESRNLHRLKDDKKTKERTEYEEDHFVRLSVSKKERNAMKQMSTLSALDGLTHFDDISALGGGGGDLETGGSSSKKRKLSGKKGKKSLKGKHRSVKKRRRN